ncbi:MAG: sensor histidine kinase [Lysobacter sp.]
MSRGVYPLDQALPEAVLAKPTALWRRYRQYPVFSTRWLRGRTLLFAIPTVSWAVLSGLGIFAETGDYATGLLAGMHFVVAVMLMASAGPLLAGWVRYQRWPLPRERRMVVVAVLAGVMLSGVADWWASAYLSRVLAAAGASDVMGGAASSISTTGGGVMLSLNLLVLLVVYAAMGGGLALRAYFSEQRRWEANEQAREIALLIRRKQRSDLRLGVLQAQVEPHFLFNVLASVRALVRQDPARAEATLDALAKHLRATIPKLRSGEDVLESTLGQQLDICASYLVLMALRMGGRLDYGIDAPPELRALAYPPLLLITLVENAVKHGIEPQPGPGRIDVRATVELEWLCVSVTDNGAGLKAGIGSGVGLENVRAQLAARFGDRASLRLRGLPGAGASAEIRLPMTARVEVPVEEHLEAQGERPT